MGVTDFYGPGSQFSVDTTRPFTVVTRFHATGGELTEIEQVYVQDGKEDPPPFVNQRLARIDAPSSRKEA